MLKIDAFAHVLPPKYYQAMLQAHPEIEKQYPFVNIPALVDLDTRLSAWPDADEKQIVSFANINAEDYFDSEKAAKIAQAANHELEQIVAEHADYFAGGVGMLVFNNLSATQEIIQEIANSNNLVGAQIFTRHLGKSIADPEFFPILKTAAKDHVPLWLHPVFDQRKPDNNLVFSWEYELSQAMLQFVQAGIFEKLPNLKILVHHAGAMVPFFAGRIEHILSAEKAKDFKKFYVDTAILGNPSALKLTIAYYGIDHVLYGTDAPFAVMPAGASQIINQAIADLHLSDADQAKILFENYRRFIEK